MFVKHNFLLFSMKNALLLRDLSKMFSHQKCSTKYLCQENSISALPVEKSNLLHKQPRMSAAECKSKSQNQ